MSVAPHRIRRLCWKVNSKSNTQAFAIRHQLRSQVETMLLPVFGNAFDGLGVDDEVVRIPRLMLDLKLRADEDFITALSQELRARLKEVLREVVSIHPEQADVRRHPAPVSQRQTLLHYLVTGRIEWHALAGNLGSHTQKLRSEARTFTAEGKGYLNILNGSLTQRAATCFRLLQLLPDQARPTLLAHALFNFNTASPVSSQLPDSVDSAIAILPVVLQQLGTSAALGGYLQLRVQALLLALRTNDLHYPLDSYIHVLLRECFEQMTLPAETAATLRAVLHVLTHSVSGTEVAPHSGVTSPGKAKQDSILPTQTNAPNKGDWSPASLNQGSSIAAIAKPDTHLSSKTLDENLGSPALDAGLILLHPFLVRLFNTVGITSSDTQKLAESTLPRAAAVLHWLLSGRGEVFEFELTTIKVLLGFSPKQLLPVASGLLSDADRSEADHLLASTISHWTALGKISVDGLRTSFLQRPGILRDTGHGWQLQMEPKSFDMLLTKLPWGISIVRLPWMTRPIFTDWPMP